jgi:hypothetical protein
MKLSQLKPGDLFQFAKPLEEDWVLNGIIEQRGPRTLVQTVGLPGFSEQLQPQATIDSDVEVIKV